MHELLAPLLYAIDFDSLDPSLASTSSLDPELAELCDPTWIAADAHALFSVIMANVGEWYEWQEPPAPPHTDGQVEIKPFIAPIVTICNTIHGQYLRNSDPALFAKLKESQIEPQIYGM